MSKRGVADLLGLTYLGRSSRADASIAKTLAKPTSRTPTYVFGIATTSIGTIRLGCNGGIHVHWTGA